MTFLKNNDSLKRLEIQFNGFLNTQNLAFLKDLISIETFSFDYNSIKFSKELSASIKTNLRLGNRLEYFFAFCILQSNNFEMLAKNIQIIEDKITIGELDFIVLDIKKNKVIHLEIANKFYLFDSNIKGKNKQWIGPNRNDSLLQKIDKLQAKQFPLLYHQKTKEIVSRLNIETTNISQKLLFNTQLFVPIESYKERKNEQNVDGFYLSKEKFEDEIFKHNLYFIPEKQDWQVSPKYCENWFTYAEIQASVNMYLAENKSPLVWLKKPDNSFQKCFIVWW